MKPLIGIVEWPYLDKDEEWIDNILTKKDVKLENIFYAFYKDKNIFIIKQSDLI